MRRLLLLLLPLAACGGGRSHDGELWQAYLHVSGFTEDEAPVDENDIADLTDSLCAMDGVRLGAYLDESEADGHGDRRLELALTGIQCPDESGKFR